ncbi:rRNA maturation RNase YbeY [Chitinivorax sp. B]|uniref:rRNA maturation RNase YbeY n=1 Tax=Chitinivorax sp. B TaxID=2502235 RepID=UPI0010F87176|nr:rRNA maturation RNase YbeY [Chitinivorax sp. B]
MATPQLSLSVQYALKPDDVPTRHQFRRWVKAALQGDAEVTLRVVDSEEGQTLNREYRDKDYATNVLTFVYDDMPEDAGLPLMGDIVLCDPVVRREAQEQGKALEAHYAHLVVHGVLHLQGYDHETDDEAEGMEALETQIVTKLGYDNPYQIKEDQ